LSIILDRRPLIDAEREQLAGSTTRIWLLALPGVLFRYVLVFLLLMGLVMSIVAVVDGMARKSPAGFSFLQWQPPPWATPVIIVAIWGPIFLVPVHFATRSLRRRLRRQRARSRDRGEGIACIARVDGARFVSVVSRDGGEVLLFELDAARSLLLDGERPRYDYPLFGLTEPENADDDERDEDEMPPADAPGGTPFPNSRFDLHWLPHSGRLLRIEPHGETVSPLRVFLDNELPLPERTSFRGEPDRDVLLLQRSLDTILAEARVAL
jgi:hypothetical protein